MDASSESKRAISLSSLRIVRDESPVPDAPVNPSGHNFLLL